MVEKKEKQDLDNATPSVERTVPFAVMAHEIRTPLGAMLSLGNLLGETELNDQQREYVQSLQNATTSLLTMLNDVLDYEKLSANALELTNAPIDLGALIRDLCTLFTPACHERGLDITFHISQDFRTKIMGDLPRLRQVLTNFITNAIKFTDTGKISIELTSTPLDNLHHQITLSVRDTGIGITQDQQARLFKPFAQADAKIAENYGGTGLGLAICAKLAALMDGKIGCTSQPGSGSEFWISFPTSEVCLESDDSENRLVDPATTISITDSVGLNGARILVAEDNHINRTLIATYLSRFGCEFEFVDNGKAALALVQESQFDLILMDIHMPEMSGSEATAKIRQLSPPLMSIPIIALSADRPGDNQKKYDNMGFDGFISKPVKPEFLYNSMCKLLHSLDRRAAG